MGALFTFVRALLSRVEALLLHVRSLVVLFNLERPSWGLVESSQGLVESSQGLVVRLSRKFFSRNPRGFRFLRSLQLPYRLQTEPQPTPYNSHPLISQLESLLHSVRFETLSVMSPKIFSIFPNTKENNTDLHGPSLLLDNKLLTLSPTLLSFHREGFLSIPSIFDLLSLEQREVGLWLEQLLHAAGAEQKLGEALNKLEPRIEGSFFEGTPVVPFIQ